MSKNGSKNWKKIGIIAGIVLLVLIAGGAAYHRMNAGVVTVQTGKVASQDLASVVTASGEIKPLNYVNISSNAFGIIRKLYVQEGDRVKKGQLLAQIDNVQPESNVKAMQAALGAAGGDATAAEAAGKLGDMTRKQYEAGYIDFQTLLGAQLNEQLATINLVQAQTNRLGDTAALYQALGGGWWNHDATAKAEARQP